MVIFWYPTSFLCHLCSMADTLGSCCPCLRHCHTFHFHSITFEGMHWFHSKSAEVCIIVQCRSVSILVIICHIVAELWSFFQLCFYSLDIGFRSISWRNALLFIRVCRTVYHCKIRVKFDIGNHLQNFGRVMALFRFCICCCVDIGFCSITFAIMQWFLLKFAEGYIIVKYRSSWILVIITAKF